MLNFIFFVIGIIVIYLNYMIIEWPYIDSFLYYSIQIIICIILVTLLQSVKSKIEYKSNFILYIKNTMKSLINNVFISQVIITINFFMMDIMDTYVDKILDIKGLVGDIFTLISLVPAIIIVLVVPIFIIYRSVKKTDKVFYKAYKKYLDRQREKDLQERREREEKRRKEEEQYLQYQNERELKINNIIEINNRYAENIFESVLDKNEYLSNSINKFKTDCFYMFDNKLNTICVKSKEIWVNNDEKLSYYTNVFENLNNRCSGNFINYIDKLIQEGTNLQYNIDALSKELNVVSKLSTANNYKLKSFKSYIDIRYNHMMKDYKGCKAGIEGEERVNKELDLHPNIVNLKNIRLEVKDNNNQINSIENDNILLTKNGIFVLEVKNYGQIGNYDIIIEKDGRWNRKDKINGTISPINNVIKQNNRHIGFLNKFINESTNRNFDAFVEVDGIIVIANEKITIENHNKYQNVFRDSELYSYIKSKPVIFTKDELDDIENLIKNNNLEPKRYPVYDYVDEIIGNIRHLEVYIGEMKKVVASLENQYHKLIAELRNI